MDIFEGVHTPAVLPQVKIAKQAQCLGPWVLYQAQEGKPVTS